MQGKIKTLKSDKGFGFITPDGESKDVFFHTTGLVGVQFPELNIGDSVTFEVEQSEKGPKAVQVSKA
jgi:CspA family cold shock protein